MRNHYAQTDAQGVCIGLLSTSGEVNAANMLLIVEGAAKIGQRWTGAAWADGPDVESDKAVAELQQIDRDTGMSRAMREALIAIADKVGADAAFLKAKEAEAGPKRLKVKK